MEWYEWVFDGIGTALVGLISGFVGYKAAIKKVSRQRQTAKDNAKQKQEMIITDESGDKGVQSYIRQTQKAGNYAKQSQCGEFKHGE